MPETLLIIPPVYGYDYPPLGTPALCAYLKKHGVDSRQIDLNVGYRDFLLSALKTAGLDEETKKDILRPLLNRLFETLPRSRYYSGLLPREGYGFLPYLPYEDSGNSSFYFAERLLSSPHLFRYLRDPGENTFLQYYLRARTAEQINAAKVALVGLSVTSPSQAIATLTFCALLRKKAPKARICLGGQWVTLFRKELLRRKDLWDLFDFAIPFEGERPLLRLAQALNDAGNSAPQRGILSRDSRPKDADRPDYPDMDELPCPDFSGLPLDRYDGNGIKARTLTCETSRGCYWSRCAYCVDLPLPRPPYRAKSAALAAGDMARLKNTHGAKRLMCGDPGMSPSQMRALSKEILRRGLKISWWTMARLDAGFSPRLFRLAKKAGLYQINFGFESACDAVCARLDKGNLRARSGRIIRACSSAGIKVDLQTMLGLPGETPQQALETVGFLVENRKDIADVSFNLYYLTPSNRIFLNPKAYGIKYKYDPRLPFRFFHPFENVRGMAPEQAMEMMRIHRSLLDRARATTLSGKRRLSGSAKERAVKLRLGRLQIGLWLLQDASDGSSLLLTRRELLSLKKSLQTDAARSASRPALSPGPQGQTR